MADISSVSYHQIASDRAKHLGDVFKNSPPLSTEPFTYMKGTNDFGVVIKKLLLLGNISNKAAESAKRSSQGTGYGYDVRTEHLSNDMQELGKRLGFKVVFSRPSYFPRDHFIFHSNPKMRFISGVLRGKNVQIANDLALSLQLRKRNSAVEYTDHDALGVVCGSAASQNPSSFGEDYMEHLEKKMVPECPLYLEGGNIYRVTTPKGEHLLIGSFLEEVNLPLGRLLGFFESSLALLKKKGLDIPIPPELSNEKAYAYVQEMFALGYFKLKGTSGVLSLLSIQGVQRNRKEGKSFTQQAVKKRKMVTLEKFGITPNKNLSAYGRDERVRSYAREKALLPLLFAMGLCQKQPTVSFLPQFGYHLDVFMRPGPKGEMMIQDYALVKKVLESIRAHKAVFALTKKDETILERYIETAEKLGNELDGLQQRCVEILKRAGFPVRPFPAAFYDRFSKDAQTYHVNFINGISGFSTQTGKYYYITTGAEVGDQLGQALMDAVTVCFQKMIPEIEVYFVGRDPSNPRGFSEPMKYWNRLGGGASQSGLHCMTVELETETHRHD